MLRLVYRDEEEVRLAPIVAGAVCALQTCLRGKTRAKQKQHKMKDAVLAQP